MKYKLKSPRHALTRLISIEGGKSGNFPVTSPSPITPSYSQKVLNTQNANLLAYWPLNERVGTNADNLEGTAAYDGTYVSVTVGVASGPDGTQAAIWNGGNSYLNIGTCSLRAVVDADEGTLAVWARTASAAWVDSALKKIVSIKVDANNSISIEKGPTNNEVVFNYRAGATDASRTKTVGPLTTWQHYVVTWSASSDESHAFHNGALINTLSGLGTWSGVPVAGSTIVGALNSDAVNPFWGHIGHVALWNVPLNATEASALGNI